MDYSYLKIQCLTAQGKQSNSDKTDKLSYQNFPHQYLWLYKKTQEGSG